MQDIAISLERPLQPRSPQPGRPAARAAPWPVEPLLPHEQLVADGYATRESLKPEECSIYPKLRLVSTKVLQYASKLYGSAPPTCIAMPSWFLSPKERETQEYTSHLYCSTPPICTELRLPFARQYFPDEGCVFFTYS